MRNDAAKVSKKKTKRWGGKKRTFQLFRGQTVRKSDPSGLALHSVCDGMRDDSSKKVNGPVNNGASASLHSVSVQLVARRLPVEEIKCG